MDDKTWNPDSKILERFEAYIRKNAEKLKSDRITAGRRVLTLKDVLKEMRRGTNIGRLYYHLLVESYKAIAAALKKREKH